MHLHSQEEAGTGALRFQKVGFGEVAISVITYGELLYRANKSEQRVRSLATVQEFVRMVPALPVPENAGEAYGFIRAELERRSEVVGPWLQDSRW